MPNQMRSQNFHLELHVAQFIFMISDILLEDVPTNWSSFEIETTEPFLDYLPLESSDNFSDQTSEESSNDESLFPFENLINLLTTDNNALLTSCDNVIDYLSEDSSLSFNFNDLSNDKAESENQDVLSVLGVDLNLQCEEKKIDFSIQSELDNLISETVMDVNINDFDLENFLGGDTVNYFTTDVVLEMTEIDNNKDIIEKFPHIKDQNNLRRRCLLYENNNKVKSNTSFTIVDKNRTQYYKRRAQEKPAPSKCNDDKYFTCPMADCDKIYAKTSHLKAHLRRHSGEKPFACNWKNCSWRFSRSDELARHKRSHSGIKPYKCEMCEKAFARSDHLAKHRNVHRKKMGLLSGKTSKRKL